MTLMILQYLSAPSFGFCDSDCSSIVGTAVGARSLLCSNLQRLPISQSSSLRAFEFVHYSWNQHSRRRPCGRAFSGNSYIRLLHQSTIQIVVKCNADRAYAKSSTWAILPHKSHVQHHRPVDLEIGARSPNKMTCRSMTYPVLAEVEEH